jgi:hypothetical protein
MIPALSNLFSQGIKLFPFLESAINTNSTISANASQLILPEEGRTGEPDMPLSLVIV